MIRYFVRHPVAANLLMVMICILGIAVVSNIERETFPEFTADSVAVSVAYPGASAVDVDEEICAPLEDALSGLTGLADFECLSVDSRAAATAELAEGGNIIQFFNDVFSAVSGINAFPDDAETPAVEVASRTDLVAMIAISGIAGKDGLIAYADELSDRLLALQGVADAQVSGISDRELQITFDQQALRRFGLSSRDLVDAIEARSLQTPLGNVELTGSSLVLRYVGASRSVAKLEDLIVLENSEGGLVRLRDLASVRLVDSDENSQSFINGDQTAIISISKARDEDSIRVFDRVDAALQAEEAAYPAPFKITVINNMTELVEERLALILRNIAMGLVLVFGTMWLFFSLREALWITAALPVSFLGGLFVMSLLGITINMITLIALLMAVGLIMDDSIVIAENIDKWRRKAPPLEAAAKGTMEVMPGVLSSFLTTACVFGPLMFLSGEMGQILQFIPMVLLITLALSLVEGFLILPNHLSHVAGIDPEAHETRTAARLLERFKEGVLLPIATRFAALRYLTFGMVIAALILTVGLIASGQVKVIGFPSTESDSIVTRVSLTSGIARERSVATVEQLLAGLERVDADLTPGTTGGRPLVERVLVQYGVNSDVNDNGSHTATITVDLLESSERNVRADDVLEAWRAATGPLPDIVQISFSQSEAGPGGLDLDVELLGRDLGVLEEAAGALLRLLLDRPDVTEAFQDFYGGRKEVQVELNEFGYSVGLTPQSLSSQLRNAFEGSETDSFRQGASDQNVRVLLADTVSSLTELEQFPVVLTGGAQTSLATVADLALSSSYPNVTRKNGMAVARIQGKIDRSVTTSTAISSVVLNDLAPQLAQDYPGVEIKIGGATEEQQQAQSSMMTALGLGLVGVYMVLAFQFRSYTLPVVIMLSIPFALIGSILGHWALGLDFSMPSMIGFASLAGIVVNNAILFLTFFQTHLEGDDYVSASLNAVRDRFRPILLSTSTTFVGLVPIIAETSPQVQTMVPLVVSVAFGLVASMILVVLIFPAVLSIYFDMVSVRKWIGQFDQEESTRVA
ncbi:efflux RND transporter permease subunit [Rhodalgimonas zhirmunskyi]|uniref:Efflux RND transporter permease subunit n=1 Tax=Rhodalgimonas zhirmunskyi TaxID=2964767 RepID=A0AAJ1U888_9RHOB|nr:efflux RND transporter permease subunit [Rhodoalgimonas zhirmunskyi]MDQ2095161.1 efflux RND transporter permease subunit [Rhodoalgimonas zhirmunskyi]